MGVAQIVVIVILTIKLLVSSHYHGTNMGKHNFWIKLLSVIIWLALLFWGGFFKY